MLQVTPGNPRVWRSAVASAARSMTRFVVVDSRAHPGSPSGAPWWRRSRGRRSRPAANRTGPGTSLLQRTSAGSALTAAYQGAKLGSGTAVPLKTVGPRAGTNGARRAAVDRHEARRLVHRQPGGASNEQAWPITATFWALRDDGVRASRLWPPGRWATAIAGRVEGVDLDRKAADRRMTLDRHLHGFSRARPEGRAEPAVVDRDRDLHGLARAR